MYIKITSEVGYLDTWKTEQFLLLFIKFSCVFEEQTKMKPQKSLEIKMIQQRETFLLIFL